MKTYKELRDGLFEEVSKIDLSKLSIGFGGLESYADLLEKMSKLPDDSIFDKYSKLVSCGFVGSPVPKVEEGGK